MCLSGFWDPENNQLFSAHVPDNGHMPGPGLPGPDKDRPLASQGPPSGSVNLWKTLKAAGSFFQVSIAGQAKHMTQTVGESCTVSCWSLQAKQTN